MCHEIKKKKNPTILSLLVFVVSGPIVGFSHDNLPFYLLTYQYPVTLGKSDTTGSWFCAHYRYAFLAHTILSLQNPTVCQPPNRHVCRQACRFLDQIFILSVIHKGLQAPCSFFTSGICSQISWVHQADPLFPAPSSILLWSAISPFCKISVSIII